MELHGKRFLYAPMLELNNTQELKVFFLEAGKL